VVDLKLVNWKARNKNRSYDCIIQLNMEKQEIFKMSCTCPDFTEFGHKLITIGENVDKKVMIKPCKHLKPAIDFLIKNDWKLKQVKEMIGTEICSSNLRERLLERANYRCEKLRGGERCLNYENLQIHRKIRGSNGGKYNMDNCIVVCKECHKREHQGEWGWI